MTDDKTLPATNERPEQAKHQRSRSVSDLMSETGSDLVGIFAVGKHLVQRSDIEQFALQRSTCGFGEFAGSQRLLAIASSVGEDLVQSIH